MEKEKINGGKLALTLIVYIFGYIILICLMSLVLKLLLTIPVINSFLLSWIDRFLGKPVTCFFGILSVLLLGEFSENVINKTTERTNELALFIFGIILVIVSAADIICSLVLLKFELISLFSLIPGVMCILGGKEFFE